MSNPYYIAFNFSVSPIVPGREILIAQLSSLGFESFVETTNGVEAYIQNTDYRSKILDEVQILGNNSFSISYKLKNIEIENWNKKWESNFKPIIVNEICQVRAPFHDSKNVEYDIIIQPKMSFGTRLDLILLENKLKVHLQLLCQHHLDQQVLVFVK